jgi:hypothetical protein
MEARTLDRAHQLVLVMVLAFNPYFWAAKDRIMSDLPFLLFCLLTLAVLQRRYVREGSRYRDTANTPRSGLLLGLLLYGCFATREAGLVVVAALLCFELFHLRKISLATGVALAVFIALAGIQQLALQGPATAADAPRQSVASAAPPVQGHAPASHIDTFRENLNASSLKLQVLRYAGAVRDIWPAGRGDLVHAAGWLAFLLTLAFATVGYLRAVFSGPGVTEIFLAGYLAAILAFAGYQGLRYLIPVIPFFFVYAFRVHRQLLHGGYRTLMLAVAALYLAATTASYAAGFQAAVRVTPMGITTEPAAGFFEFIRSQTPADSIILFQKPRVLVLLTGRRAAAASGRDPASELAYMRRIGADYLVVSRILWNGNCRPLGVQSELPGELTLEYRNDYFQVYKLQPASIPSGGAPG